MNFHYCQPKVKSVLVWSKDKDILNKSLKHLKVEFEEDLFPITIEDIPNVVEGIDESDIETEIEKYDFYLIKIHTSSMELLLLDNQRHIVEYSDEDYETPLENLARKILYHFKNY